MGQLKAGILCGVLWSLAVSAVAQPQHEARYAAVAQMGTLNGIALACRYFSESKRIKKLLIASLPKRREWGALFDEKTNQTFLRFVQTQKTCPPLKRLAADVDEAGASLRRAFMP